MSEIVIEQPTIPGLELVTCGRLHGDWYCAMEQHPDVPEQHYWKKRAGR